MFWDRCSVMRIRSLRLATGIAAALLESAYLDVVILWLLY
jgi:hypothetical protein